MDYPVYRLFIIALALVVLAIMSLLLYKTRLGRVVQAAVSRRHGSMPGDQYAAGLYVCLRHRHLLAGWPEVAIAPILTVFPGLADQMAWMPSWVVRYRRLREPPGGLISFHCVRIAHSYGVQFLSNCPAADVHLYGHRSGNSPYGPVRRKE